MSAIMTATMAARARSLSARSHGSRAQAAPITRRPGAKVSSRTGTAWVSLAEGHAARAADVAPLGPRKIGEGNRHPIGLLGQRRGLDGEVGRRRRHTRQADDPALVVFAGAAEAEAGGIAD